MIDEEPTEEPLMECPTCEGAGSFTIGDCEDGIDEPCPECLGAGVVDHYDEIKPPKRGDHNAN